MRWRVSDILRLPGFPENRTSAVRIRLLELPAVTVQADHLTVNRPLRVNRSSKGGTPEEQDQGI